MKPKCPECQKKLVSTPDGHECRQCRFLYPHSSWRANGAHLEHFIPSSNRRTIKKHERRIVLERDGHRCKSCNSKWDLTIDHIVPLSLGGTNNLENLQTLCQSCNQGKGQRIIKYRNP